MKELAPLLEALAKKLGTTVDHLWAILVRQAFISSVMDLIQYVILAVATYVFIRMTKKYGALMDEKRWEPCAVYAPAVVVGLVLLILWIAAFFCIQDTVSGFFNPEYWALNKILSRIVK